MLPFLISAVSLTLLYTRVVTAIPTPRDQPVVRPFQIDLSAGVPRMLDLINNTQLPDEPEYAGIGNTKGIDFDVLKGLREEWLNNFDWDKEQTYLNTFNHNTVEIEGLTIHFVHHKSSDPNAIPLLLTHGWPGNFMEFLPVIEPLTQPATTSTGQPVSFNVVVPSLPGFAFSSRAPKGWTLDDTARVFNTLMTDVLGYEKFAAHGTSNGALLTFTLYDSFNTTTRAAHFPLMPFYPTTTTEIEQRHVEISAIEQAIFQRSLEWTNNGTGYFLVHIYKPNTIGLGVYDHPVGQLAWAGEKWLSWSDPNAGQAPSVLTHNAILRSASLTYLTGTFMSSLYVYSQDRNLPYVEGIINRARTDAPMFVTFFRYSIGFWPLSILRLMGNLVQYHSGFFAGLENPPALMADLREIKNYWNVQNMQGFVNL